MKIKPAEGKKGIYRKEYSNKNGEAYRKFDADAKELTDKVKGKKILEAESLEIKVGGATVTVGKSGAVTINSPSRPREPWNCPPAPSRPVPER